MARHRCSTSLESSPEGGTSLIALATGSRGVVSPVDVLSGILWSDELAAAVILLLDGGHTSPPGLVLSRPSRMGLAAGVTLVRLDVVVASFEMISAW